MIMGTRGQVTRAGRDEGLLSHDVHSFTHVLGAHHDA